MDAHAFDAIMEEVRTGTSLRRAVVASGVHPQEFYRHIDRTQADCERYVRARQESLDAMAEEAVAIADDPDLPSDQKRVMVDTRKWFLSKLAPKRYGDHLEVTVSANRAANALQDAELLAIALKSAAALPVIDVEAEK